MTTPSAAPGWYPDPSGAPRARYFDGTQWAEHQSDVPAQYRLSNDTVPIGSISQSANSRRWAMAVAWITHSKSRRHRLRQRQRPSTHHICLPHPVHVRAFPVPVDRLGEHHPRAPSDAPSGPIRQHHSQRLTTSRPAAVGQRLRDSQVPTFAFTTANALTRVYTATGRRLTSGRGGDRTPDRWCVKLPQASAWSHSVAFIPICPGHESQCPPRPPLHGSLLRV